MNTVVADQQRKVAGSAKTGTHAAVMAASLFLLIVLPLVMAEPVKLYPIGDSTTYGYETQYCWRYYFYSKLIKNGCDSVDMVGSVNGPTKGTINEEWDRDHDGHSSWKASDILGSSKGNIKQWAPKLTPHIAVIYLGTNDIRGGRATADIIKTLKDIIKVLRDSREEVKIIVCQIPYWNYSKYGGNEKAVTALNKEIPSILSISTKTSPIKIVDLNSNYSVSDHKDGIHPGVKGAPKIADRVYDAVLPWLEGDQTPVMYSALQKPVRAAASRRMLRLSIVNGGSPTIWIAAQPEAASSRVRGWSIDGKVLR